MGIARACRQRPPEEHSTTSSGRTLRLAVACASSALLALASLGAGPQDKAKEPPPVRGRDGKLLFSALDTLKVHAVSSSRISPDGRRVAYTVSETRMEKDKEWKTVTQVWVVGASGGPERQFRRPRPW